MKTISLRVLKYKFTIRNNHNAIYLQYKLHLDFTNIISKRYRFAYSF